MTGWATPGQWLAILGVGVPLVALPWLGASNFVLTVALLVMFSAYLGQSWNIAGGYAGQFSFGHTVFFGSGAYVSSILHTKFGVNPWAGLVAAAAAGAAVGALVGFLSFRAGLKGSYFALITLAFAEAFRIMANSVELTGAGMGLHIPLDQRAANLQFPDRAGFYWLALAMLAISLIIARWLERSRFGARLMAIRENEDAAMALGVDTFRLKLQALMLSGAMAGIGGTFYAQYFLYIDPTLAYGVDRSVEMLLAPMIGGAGTALGPLVGAVVLHAIGEGTRHYLETPGLALMLYGLLLVLIVGFLPNGLIGLLRRRKPGDA